jgi:hypothetical protein
VTTHFEVVQRFIHVVDIARASPGGTVPARRHLTQRVRLQLIVTGLAYFLPSLGLSGDVN